MVRFLTIASRSTAAQVVGGALMTAVETGIFGLALLMMIVSTGEVALYPDTLGEIAGNILLLLLMFAVMLPYALMAALVALWPTAMIIGGSLMAGTRCTRRLAAAPVWIAAGFIIGLAFGLRLFIGGQPQFDIIEGRWAPIATLAWTATAGAFAGWRLHRKLALFAPPSGDALPERLETRLPQAPTRSMVTDPLP